MNLVRVKEKCLAEKYVCLFKKKKKKDLLSLTQSSNFLGVSSCFEICFNDNSLLGVR